MKTPFPVPADGLRRSASCLRQTALRLWAALLLRRTLAGVILILALAACATPTAEPPQTRVFIVRHAEKLADDTRDPALNDAGRRRAEALVQVLEGTPLTAVYATPYRRTAQTAQPAADAKGLSIIEYDPAQPAAEFAALLRERHPGAAVLVVGHSNTVPEITGVLCACTVAELSEDDYGDLFEVVIGAGGASLQHSHF